MDRDGDAYEVHECPSMEQNMAYIPKLNRFKRDGGIAIKIITLAYFNLLHIQLQYNICQENRPDYTRNALLYTYTRIQTVHII